MSTFIQSLVKEVRCAAYQGVFIPGQWCCYRDTVLSTITFTNQDVTVAQSLYVAEELAEWMKGKSKWRVLKYACMLTVMIILCP